MDITLPSHGFPTTQWSRVARAVEPAGVDARAAMEELCSAYWYPLYAFIRRMGQNEVDALDLTQEYFARLLQKPVLSAADPDRGRFRAFLKADCRFFLRDCHDRDQARKRGGGHAPISIDACAAAARYGVERADSLTPERLFDRAWGLALLALALDRVANEYETSGRGAIFEGLQSTLTGSRSGSYSDIASQLGLSESAVQQAAHRLRKRYKQALRDEIGATLDDPTDEAVDSEIRELFDALER